MTRRSRWLAYGGAGASIAAGGLCAALIGGTAGPVLAIALVGLGLIALISLIFLEVGLSEDRWRADDARTREAAERERRGPRPAGPLPARKPSRGAPPRLR